MPASGPKRVLTRAQVENALRLSDGLVSFAARSLRVTPRTIRKYLERYPELKEIRDEAREGLVDLAERSLAEQIKAGSAPATTFALKTLGRSRGYEEKPQVDLNVSGDIAVQLPPGFPGDTPSA